MSKSVTIFCNVNIVPNDKFFTYDFQVCLNYIVCELLGQLVFGFLEKPIGCVRQTVL